MIQWLHDQMNFLESEWFALLYGMIVFLNPIAMIPQLLSSIRSKPEELKGVAISTFTLFLIIQSALVLGAIKNQDKTLFWSMAISAIETIATLSIILVRRSKE